MKKHSFIILLASLLLLCACQPMPDEPVVLQKNQDLMIQQGSATLAPKESYTPPEVPERFTYDFADGTWTVHADAPIVVPDVPMPMVWVRSQGISQEMLYRLFKLLGNGETFYQANYDYVSTKSEIAERIQRMMNRLEDGSYKDSDLSEEEWKAAIEELKKQYQTAPMEVNREPQESDGTYQLMKGGESGTECLYLEARNEQRAISAAAAFKADESGSLFCYARRLETDGRSYDYYWTNARKIDATSDLPGGLSYAVAVAQLNEVLEAIGEPFEIESVYLMDDDANGLVDGVVSSAEHYALCFACRRLVNGAPTVCDVPGTSRTDQLFSIPWEQESFRVIIDSMGIANIGWNEPLTLLDTVSESTNLLPFFEIQNIAEKMLPILYGQKSGYEYIQSLDTQIKSVRLELIRVREQNNAKQLKGILIPVWTFYGTSVVTDKGGNSSYSDYGMGGGNDYYQGDQILLCINAIDGTVIDPLLGY